MNKSDLNYFIDIGMGLTFFISLLTGILKFKESLLLFARIGIYLPTFWLNYIHDRAGILLGFFVLIHLILHFKWIKVMTIKYIKFT
ncbi:MAG: hypothetical protein APG10_01535 [Candidatus Methanofastidiosum methylothiophilum]|uniref:DUF4405 domain-containing protein n=1 Tax=Candidatus Methanofastidiosum methylothiophilum TaxID=1705564 RepID=A0A150IIG5_9EURY|nr:MAG: hypothetical protein APG10_01535 [Candidatus Methanofastidiosum methylthiophilus]